MIGDAIRASADRSMWKPHLKKLIAGAHPHTDSKDNPAWNFQYEVYLAAATQLADCTVTLDEPDVVLKDGDQTVGIAAKRPHSLANLTTNLKKGSQQIEKAGLRGLVALDVSLVAGQNRRLIPTTALAPSSPLNCLLTGSARTTTRKSKGRPHIMGCLLTLNMPVAVRLEGGYALTSAAARRTAIHLSQNVSDLRWLTDLATRCERALFGPRAS
jgi:hypothetical protein